jgi:hypothetical protein
MIVSHVDFRAKAVQQALVGAHEKFIVVGQRQSSAIVSRRLEEAPPITGKKVRLPLEDDVLYVEEMAFVEGIERERVSVLSLKYT